MSENTYSPYGDSPGLVKTIAVMTLINGIVNIFWGLIATVTVTASIVLICLAPLAILPTILGIFEIIYAAKLLTEPPQPVQPSTTIAILEILCVLTGNVFSMIVGILALVFYNDPQVKDYFNRLNGMPVPVPPKAPVPPVPPTVLDAAPVMEAESPAETAPDAPTAPEPKKPRTRKVAAEKMDTAPEGKADSAAEKSKRTRKSGSSSS
jgi:type IV secretory pathway VirB10-like protein